jgi:tagaturonate reductase
MDILSKKYIENNSIPSEIKLGNTNDMPVKVMQFGEGNFLRAFVDWMINKINNDGLLTARLQLFSRLTEA